MTICAMTKKEIRCPECGSKLVAIRYGVDYTQFYCQNMTRDPEKQCHSIGMYCFKSYTHFDPKYPVIIRKDIWVNCGEKEESIEFTLDNYRKRIEKIRNENLEKLNKHLLEDEEYDTNDIGSEDE